MPTGSVNIRHSLALLAEDYRNYAIALLAELAREFPSARAPELKQLFIERYGKPLGSPQTRESRGKLVT